MQPQDRRYSIRIDPELRALRRSRKAAPPAPPPEVPPAAEPVPDPVPAPEAGPAAALPSPEPAFPRGSTVRLRRDGRRPLGFRGLELLSCAPPGPGGPGDRVALYLAEDGRVAAQLVRTSGPCRARPAVFRADWIGGSADLGAMLALSGPQDVLSERGLCPPPSDDARAPAGGTERPT